MSTLMHTLEDTRSKTKISFSAYNPFETKHRRRTSRDQFNVLEKTFIEDPKPTAKLREGLALRLGMSPRGVQVWFQNRRAKEKQHLKHQVSPSSTVESLEIISPIALQSAGMAHSRSQSSVSSSTSYSTDHHHVVQPLYHPPYPQQEQEPWWNNIVAATASHQTFGSAAMNESFNDYLDAWAYINSIPLNSTFVANHKVQDWISSTTRANEHDFFTDKEQSILSTQHNDPDWSTSTRRPSFPNDTTQV